MTPSVLVIAPEPAATAVAELLHQRLGMRVETVAHGHLGVVMLRHGDHQMVLLEENLAMAEPEATEALYAGAGPLLVLELNFGLCGAERVVRQVRSAWKRRELDEAKARKAVSTSLQNELNASLTGLLLESQLALRQASPEILPTLEHLVNLAAELRDHLRS